MRSFAWFEGALASGVVWALASGALGAVGGGCGGTAFSTGASDGPDGSTVDGSGGSSGGGREAGVGEAGGDAQSDGPSGEAGPGKIIYVSSSTGDETRTGLDPMHPVKSIATGLAHAATNGASTVEVCAGNYPESGLVVTRDVSLLGGFDCVHWVRAAGYGFPVFSMTNQVVVTNSDLTVQPATLVVVGTTVTPATTIDGFTIAGATSHPAVTYGVDVQGAASPVLSNLVVSGGGGDATSGNWGSVGIRVGGTSSAELKLSVVGGGSGQAAVGSVGVLDQSTGAPSIHDDVVSGGTGVTTGATPGIASVGVAILAPLGASNPLFADIVTGADTNGVAGSSAGVFVSGSGVNASLVGCEIQGGKGTDANTESVGIELDTTGTVGIVADRVFAGQRSGNGANTFGVRSDEAAAVTIANSEIHAGESASGYSAGVFLSAAAAMPAIVFDTIYTGAGSGAIALQFGSSVTQATVTDDLLVGGGLSAGNVALALPACSGVLATVDHDAFANFAELGQCPGNPTAKVATTPTTLPSVVGSASIAGDVELETTCAGATGCAQSSVCPSASAATCASGLFGSTFSTTDDGVSGLFLGPAAPDGGTTLGGWQLAAGVPCAIASGGAANTAYPKDLFDVSRAPTPSIGAAQYSSSTKCAP
jgi:hypothetical protein